MEQKPDDILIYLDKLNAGVFCAIGIFAGGISGGEMIRLSEGAGPKDHLAYAAGCLVTAFFTYTASHEWQRFHALRTMTRNHPQ